MWRLLTVVYASAARAQVIGILSTDDVKNGYAQWVEQFNASTRILPSSGPSSHVESIFQSINGLMLPGVTMGDGEVESFPRALVERALWANQQGDYFPVWGTCKGYEDLLQIVGGSRVLDRKFDAVDFPAALRLTHSSPGRMLAGANASLLEWVSAEPITYNNHGAGITPSHLVANAKLSSCVLPSSPALRQSSDPTGRAHGPHFTSPVCSCDRSLPNRFLLCHHAAASSM